MARELSAVLEFAATLRSLDLTGCEPCTLAPAEATLREDADRRRAPAHRGDRHGRRTRGRGPVLPGAADRRERDAVSDARPGSCRAARARSARRGWIPRDRRGGRERLGRTGRGLGDRACTPWCTRAAEARGAAARAASPGPLRGVPVLVKDNLCTIDYPTTCGSKILDGYRPPYDATVIRRLREAGAVLIGKGNMDEFAMGSSTEYSAATARRAIPYDLARVPGGSSGGPAAAVAVRPVPDRARLRHRRLGAAARGVLRRVRLEAHVRPALALRAGRVRLVARSGRPLRAPRGRRWRSRTQALAGPDPYDATTRASAAPDVAGWDRGRRGAALRLAGEPVEGGLRAGGACAGSRRRPSGSSARERCACRSTSCPASSRSPPTT